VFTKRELAAELLALSPLAPPPIEVIEYANYDFGWPSSEQVILAYRGSKHDFASGLRFWVQTLLVQGWQEQESYFAYAEAGLCMPVSELEFAQLVAEYSSSLKKPLPPFLISLDGFRSGLKMYAEWNNVAALAEVADAFVAFYWSTAA